MRPIFIATRIIQLLACLLVCQTIVAVLLSFRDYFPPNFRSDFLLGRSGYFFGLYQWAFYAHILSGPFTLIAGLLLLSESFRRRAPQWHRRLGKAQIVVVLLVLAPSGLWMARYATTGAVAAVGFAVLAVATAACAAMGWRAAVGRRFDKHRQWMLRCFALLCSAVVLRAIGGLSEVMDLHWTYPLAAWISWLLPLAAVEAMRIVPRSASSGLALKTSAGTR
ncbi:MAG: DUF2306 domain-containing protein [Pirellulales bacterium]